MWLLKSGAALGFGVEDDTDAIKAHSEGEVRKIFYGLPNDRNVNK